MDRVLLNGSRLCRFTVRDSSVVLETAHLDHAGLLDTSSRNAVSVIAHEEQWVFCVSEFVDDVQSCSRNFFGLFKNKFSRELLVITWTYDNEVKNYMIKMDPKWTEPVQKYYLTGGPTFTLVGHSSILVLQSCDGKAENSFGQYIFELPPNAIGGQIILADIFGDPLSTQILCSRFESKEPYGDITFQYCSIPTIACGEVYSELRWESDSVLLRNGQDSNEISNNIMKIISHFSEPNTFSLEGAECLQSLSECSFLILLEGGIVIDVFKGSVDSIHNHSASVLDISITYMNGKESLIIFSSPYDYAILDTKSNSIVRNIDSYRPVLDASTTERWPIIYNQKREMQTLLDLEKLDSKGEHLKSPVAMKQVLDSLASRHNQIIDEARQLERSIRIKEDVLIRFLDLLNERNIDDVYCNSHQEQGKQEVQSDSGGIEFYSGLRQVHPKKPRVAQRQDDFASLSVPPVSGSMMRMPINPVTNICVQSHQIEYDGIRLNMKVTIRSKLRFPIYNIGSSLLTGDLNKSNRSILVAELNPDSEATLHLTTELEYKSGNALAPLLIWWSSRKDDHGPHFPSFNYIEKTLCNDRLDVHRLQLIDVFHIHLNEKVMGYDAQLSTRAMHPYNTHGCRLSISVHPNTITLPQSYCLADIFPNLRAYKGEKYLQFDGALCASSSIKVRGIYYGLSTRQDYELVFKERSESNIFLRKLSQLMPEGVTIRPNLASRKILELLEESITGLQAELKLILELIYRPTQENIPTTNLEPPLAPPDKMLYRFVLLQLHTDFSIGRLLNELLPMRVR